MIITVVLAALAVLSLLLLGWQIAAAVRFPLHRRQPARSFAPPVLVLKPLKGCDEYTRDCLRSWLTQEYPGRFRVLFGVAEPADPACGVVRALLAEFPRVDATLLITPEALGPNAKVSNLAQLFRAGTDPNAGLGKEEGEWLVCISDADVRVAADFLANAVAPLQDPAVGLVTSLYRLASPKNFAMEIEALAVNADFWSQVLQANTLKPQDFALGAVMLTRSTLLGRIGGLISLAEYLADDFELGHRIAGLGLRIVLCPLVVECWDPQLTLRQVWAHQLRWSRTIRASQPVPYFFSVLNNVTLWATAFAASAAAMGIYRVGKGYPWHFDLGWIGCAAAVWGCCVAARFAAARHLVERLTSRRLPWSFVGVALARDLLGFGVWAGAFAGNTVTWRGRTFRIGSGGKLREL